MLFIDLVGSTALASKLGDKRWNKLLDRHNTRVGSILDRYNGREVASAGDAC